MRSLKLYVSTLALAGLASLPVVGQQPSDSPSPSTPQSVPSNPDPGSGQSVPGQANDPTPQPSGPQQQKAVPVPSTANSPEATNTELRPVDGELEKKLDAKSAKAGDAVVLKTTEAASIGNGVIIPKGSKIVGHVVDAMPTGNGSQNSKVTVQFDQAELKGGQTLPVRSILQSVAPPTDASGPDASAASSTPGAGSTSMSAPAPGAPASAPGMSGGSAASQPGQAPSATGTAPMASANNAASGNSAPAAGTVVATQGNVAIKTTAIPGVLIGASANGQPFSNAAGVILGARQNVHLDGGTHMVLALAQANTKGTNTR